MHSIVLLLNGFTHQLCPLLYNTTCCNPKINCTHCVSCMSQVEYMSSLQYTIYNHNSRRKLTSVDTIFSSITIGFISNANLSHIRFKFTSLLDLPQNRLAIPEPTALTNIPYKIHIRYAKDSHAISHYNKLTRFANDSELTNFLNAHTTDFKSHIHLTNTNDSDKTLRFFTFLLILTSILSITLQYVIRKKQKINTIPDETISEVKNK